MNEPLVLLGGARTPQAKSFGPLWPLSAVELAEHSVRELLDRMNVGPEQIDELIFGNVATPPDAANIARVISLRAGLPQHTIAHTVSRNCGSGMEAILSSWLAIESGRSQLIVAGGTESMSNVPMFARPSLQRKLIALAKARSSWQKLRAIAALRPADLRLIPGLKAGLKDPICGLSMGDTAEVLAAEFAISREDQDAFALRSHELALAAQKECFLSGEIAPLDIDGQRIEKDTCPRPGQSLEQLQRLQPVFRAARPDREPTVTAGNSSPITDGATAVLVTSPEGARRMNLPPLAKIRHATIVGCDPRRMGLGPVFAIEKLLRETGLALSDIDLFEINEAFAAQVLACVAAVESDSFAKQYLNRSKRLGTLPLERLNVHGGAIALGHPVGASGARIVFTLARALQQRGGGIGIASLCIGGGQGMAMLIESAPHTS